MTENKQRLGSQRSGSARRRAGEAAIGHNRQAAAASGNVKQRDTFEYTDQLMEQLGTPEMLIQELKAAKRDIETLRIQLQVKDKSVANYRAEATKMRKENFELKKEIIQLKEQISKSNNEPSGSGAAANQPDNDLAAARQAA